MSALSLIFAFGSPYGAAWHGEALSGLHDLCRLSLAGQSDRSLKTEMPISPLLFDNALLLEGSEIAMQTLITAR